jgi:ABC-type uncharacterized transport system substrate-binding protein
MPMPAVAAAVLFASTAPASVHPHVFAEARLEVTVGPGETVGSLRHVWRFDEVFSSGEVLLAFDANQDLNLDNAELEAAGATFHQSLAEFDYFQFMTIDGKDVELAAPEQLMVTFEDGQMIVLFESKPSVPVKLSGTIGFGVYDPSFYIAIDFADDAQLAATGLPAGCRQSVIRPDEDQMLSQGTLTEQFFENPGASGVGEAFATRLELTCGSPEKPS